MRAECDLVVIGAGIVGLATAWRWQQRRRGASVVVLEKEDRVAAHQTGRNSGGIHSGIYYKPGSLKATNCRRGRAMLLRFCQEHGIAHEICGKVIVAVDGTEVPALERIAERGSANGVACEPLGPEELAELEPHAAGVAALHVPEAGIVDFSAVAEKLRGLIEDAGGEVRLDAPVQTIRREQARVIAVGHGGGAGPGTVRAQRVVNCAGLHSDRLIALAGGRRPARIVPFRGEYYRLLPGAARLCRNLIYPVPDPRFPFLGVHLTRLVGGGVECGPNAVPALAREGYTWHDVRLADVADMLGYPGFWRLAARHWRTGAGEIIRSLSKPAYVRALRRHVPDLGAADLERAPSGVRAQALGPDGKLGDDFVIQREDGIVHLCNAPSPAATAALAIGDRVVDTLG